MINLLCPFCKHEDLTTEVSGSLTDRNYPSRRTFCTHCEEIRTFDEFQKDGNAESKTRI